MRTLGACQSEYLQTLESQHERREQADLPCTHHEGSLRTPYLHAALCLVGLLDRLGCTTHRLHEHVQILKPLRDSNNVVLVVDKVLGQITMQQIDTAFIVSLLAGHVVSPDLIVDRSARTTNGGRDIVPNPNVANIGADLEDYPKGFMSEHQVVIARGSVPIQRVIDLSIRCVNSNLEHLDQYTFSILDRVQFGLRNIPLMNAVGSSRTYGNRFHKCKVSAEF